jgi:speckle-type POZ protein
MEDGSLETEMAQHLLAAADQLQLERLRRICERRLCETVDVESVAFTLALADRNHSEELKKVCCSASESREKEGVDNAAD